MLGSLTGGPLRDIVANYLPEDYVSDDRTLRGKLYRKRNDKFWPQRDFPKAIKDTMDKDGNIDIDKLEKLYIGYFGKPKRDLIIGDGSVIPAKKVDPKGDPAPNVPPVDDDGDLDDIFEGDSAEEADSQTETPEKKTPKKKSPRKKKEPKAPSEGQSTEEEKQKAEDVSDWYE